MLAVAAFGDSTYVGGDFALIGRATGSWAGIAGSGAVRPIRAVVQGDVAEAVTDGRGGWFLRGDISAVGDTEVEKTEIVHLRATGISTRRGQSRPTVRSTQWVVSGSGCTWGVVLQAQRCGAREPGGDRRAHRCAPPVAAEDLGPHEGRPGRGLCDRAGARRQRGLRRGRLRSRGRHRATVACSRSRRRGTPSLRPGAGHGDTEEDEDEVTASVAILSVDPRGRVLYAAGDFAELGGAERPGLGSVDTRTGRARPWNPDCDGDVWAIEVAPAGSPVYVAGEFASIGGKSRRGLAAVDARAGTATPGTPASEGLSMRSRSMRGGRSSSRAVSSSPSATPIAPTSQQGRGPGSRPWDVPVIGTIDVVEPAGEGGVVVGESRVRRGAETGRPRGARRRRELGHRLAASIRGVVRAIAPDPHHGRMYVGGRFSVGDSRTQRSLATLEVASGSLAPARPSTRASGRSLPAAMGRPCTWAAPSRRWTGRRGVGWPRAQRRRRHAPAVERRRECRRPHARLGRRGALGRRSVHVDRREQRRGVAAVEIASAQTAGWDASANGNVESVAVSGETVYVAGSFTAVGGRSRKHLAALEAADGAATRAGTRRPTTSSGTGRRPDGSQLAVGATSNVSEEVAGMPHRSTSPPGSSPTGGRWRRSPRSRWRSARTGTLFVGEGAIVVFRWPPVL